MWVQSFTALSARSSLIFFLFSLSRFSSRVDLTLGAGKALCLVDFQVPVTIHASVKDMSIFIKRHVREGEVFIGPATFPSLAYIIASKRIKTMELQYLRADIHG